MITSETCRTEKRRELVRRRGYNGLDYVEVADDKRNLRVTFIGKAPGQVSPANLRITGGRRVRDLQVLGTNLVKSDREDQDDVLLVELDRPGDLSRYTLELINAPEPPLDHLLDTFDPRYRAVTFAFHPDVAGQLDCREGLAHPAPTGPEPESHYLAKDYASFRQLVLDRLSVTMPDWQERHLPDVVLAVVEVLAYVADHLSYYQDSVATEAYLGTARRRISVRRHARLVDYRLHEGCNARTWVLVRVEQDLELPRDRFYFAAGLPEGAGSGSILREEELPSPPSAYEVFEPVPTGSSSEPWVFCSAHNEIAIYTWGNSECCLPPGTTRVTLVDDWMESGTMPANADGHASSGPSAGGESRRRRRLRLRPGDFLLLEETKGPVTGLAADADPVHRHVVRLVEVRPGEDPLSNQPVLEVAWEREDALPFALFLSSVGPAAPPPGQKPCQLIESITVARGNLLLVDHGRWVEDVDCPTVELAETVAACAGECQPVEIIVRAQPTSLELSQGPLTFAVPVPPREARRWSARKLMEQDPRVAIPQIRLDGIPGRRDGAGPSFTWSELDEAVELAERIRRSEPPSAHPVWDLLSARTREVLRNPVSDVSATQMEAWIREDLGAVLQRWVPASDLLGSQADDAHFMVEVDDDGRAHLRFGDGESGRAPRPGDSFRKRYRVGSGSAGNVGAETINRLVLRKFALTGATISVRNPLPAVGGAAVEPIEEARQSASTAFLARRQRAVSPEDYAEEIERHSEVQRAAGEFRWTGAWYEVVVAVDPRGTEELPGSLKRSLRRAVYPLRRMGHDVRIVPARYVPLEIELRVAVLPDYVNGHIESELRDVFTSGIRRDGTPGFFHPDGLSFGEPVYLSRIVATAMSVEGVKEVSAEVFRRWGEEAEDTGEAMETGRLDLDHLEVAQCGSDPQAPECGAIRFRMEGGR